MKVPQIILNGKHALNYYYYEVPILSKQISRKGHWGLINTDPLQINIPSTQHLDIANLI